MSESQHSAKKRGAGQGGKYAARNYAGSTLQAAHASTRAAE
ncbi:hypothetical protein BSU04_39360 [Caballeronia sordidicola]|uniref:Uncharacterized protein n=1 Tax=Caballeronia sordidicola TaxID=196367 RepID=A0A226WQB9_CABSO|nr:hypothetical protein BSU04_39360 [Caballeronia sordidicola]